MRAALLIGAVAATLGLLGACGAAAPAEGALLASLPLDAEAREEEGAGALLHVRRSPERAAALAPHASARWTTRATLSFSLGVDARLVLGEALSPGASPVIALPTPLMLSAGFDALHFGCALPRGVKGCFLGAGGAHGEFGLRLGQPYRHGSSLWLIARIDHEVRFGPRSMRSASLGVRLTPRRR